MEVGLEKTGRIMQPLRTSDNGTPLPLGGTEGAKGGGSYQEGDRGRERESWVTDQNTDS